jgi:hypothetical protein
MAEQRVRATREHGRHPPPLWSQAAVPDGVDTAVQAEKPAGASPPLDLIP